MLDVADALEKNENFIMAENEADVDSAREAGYDESLVSRLALKPGKASKCLLLLKFALEIYIYIYIVCLWDGPFSIRTKAISNGFLLTIHLEMHLVMENCR